MYRGGRGGSRGGGGSSSGWSGNNDNWAQDHYGGGGPSQRYNFAPSQYQDDPQYNQGGRRGGGRGSETDNDGAGGSSRFRPPPHLRGRAIGLWYRDRNREKQKKEGKLSWEEKMARRMTRYTMVPIELPDDKVSAIWSLLDSISCDSPPTITKFRQNSKGERGNVRDKYRHIEDSEFKRRFLRSISGTMEERIRKSVQDPHVVLERNSEADDRYREELMRKTKDSEEYLRMLEVRKALPAYDKAKQLLDAVRNNAVILVSGETGCGKTTQVPQLILDEEVKAGRGSLCHILCTQPRRISAVSVAERVAQERAEELGVSVGYQIRLERVMPRKTGSVIYCTTGILLQLMQGDPALTTVSHVILDEIHERDVLSDFAITILKQLITLRKDLKVILMSATLNAAQFSKYFDSCPTVHIPGFTFPVKEYYLEDVLQSVGVYYSNSNKRVRWNKKTNSDDDKYLEFLQPYVRNMRAAKRYKEDVLEYLVSPDAEEINLELVMRLLHHIGRKEPPGAVLVFLPGWDKISALVNKINDSNLFPSSQYVVVPLHSMMPTITQKLIFNRPPPGKRKIVIATNIAETSITIDDIVYVVNCGKIKMKNFDAENNISTLQEEWVSLANSRQRRGRAGRVQEGVCYHLYTRPKEMMLDSYQLPEMLRTRLEEVILQIKVLQLGRAQPFLSEVMDPPSSTTVDLSIKLLKEMKALDDEEHLTPLGYHLANLPIDPQPGKMVLLAALFSCLDPVTSIAASLSFKDAFVIPLGKEKEVKKVKTELCKGSQSDHILMSEAMKEWRDILDRRGYGAAKSFISDFFLSQNTLQLLKDMKNQFTDHLYQMKFLSERNTRSDVHNINSNNFALIRSVICSGLYPNVALAKKKKRGGCRVLTPEDGSVSLHIKSVNCDSLTEDCFLVYFLKMKSSSVFLHDTTVVYPMSLIFFCHGFTVTDTDNGLKLITLNNHMCFKCTAQVAQIIQELRGWLDWLLEYKIAHPGTIDWSSSSDETIILKAIVVLLTEESRLYGGDCYDDDDDDDYEDGDEMNCDYVETRHHHHRSSQPSRPHRKPPRHHRR